MFFSRLNTLIRKGLVLGCSIVALSSATHAADTKPKFEDYVQGLKQEALDNGFSQTLVDQAFANLTYKEKVVKADKNQPEFVQTLDTYLPKRINKWVVNKANKLYQDKKELLNEIGKAYGVQPRFIVALWGLESSFGKHRGKMPVIASLVTLAYEGRRESLYRPQIFKALQIVQEGEITLEQLKGSWAGAMGQTQFMPSSFHRYAVDYDGDGKRDIWNTEADVFASIANYLKTEGWNDDLTWGREVKLPEGFDVNNAIPPKTRGRSNWLKQWAKTEKTLADWKATGVMRTNGKPIPVRNINAALLFPDDENGRAFLAYDNYKVLMHWNRSYYFVTSVGVLADQIKTGPWPVK